MYMALIESNLGNNYAPSTGYDSSTREAVFSIGLQGVSKDDFPEVERIIFSTLEQSAEQGFPPERIEAVLHRLEISQKLVNADFGLNLAASLATSWIHGGCPVSYLSINEHIKRVRARVAEGPFFQQLIRDYLLNNKHRLTLQMTADAEYLSKQIEEEKHYVDTIRSKMTTEDEQTVVHEAITLTQLQSQPQDPSVLPTVTLDDIERHKPYPNVLHTELHSTPVQYCAQPTNEVVYLNATLSLHGLPSDLVPLVPLFATLLTTLGAGGLDRRAFSLQSELYTGSMTCNPCLVLNTTDSSHFKSQLVLSSFSLERNVPAMLGLWANLFTDADWTDADHLKTLLLTLESDFRDSLVDDGHLFARRFAASRLSTLGSTEESWEGVTQARVISELLAGDLDQLIVKLQQLAGYLLNRNSMKVAINAEQKALETVEGHLEAFLRSIPKTANADLLQDTLSVNTPFPPPSEKCFLGLPADCNFVTMCFPGVQYTHSDYTKLQVLAHILTNGYLHGEIREKGGAYGGGASFGANGVMSLYSYRDPNLVPTLQHFNDSIQWILDNKFSEENIVEAKLNVFSAVDRPVPPSKQGLTAFVADLTPPMQARNRALLFEVDRHDIKHVAAKYMLRTPSIAAFGSELQAQRLQRDGWLLIE